MADYLSVAQRCGQPRPLAGVGCTAMLEVFSFCISSAIVLASPEMIEKFLLEFSDVIDVSNQENKFRYTKDELMKADDMKKNRSLLRSHAKGLAARSAVLQETATRLQR